MSFPKPPLSTPPLVQDVKGNINWASAWSYWFLLVYNNQVSSSSSGSGDLATSFYFGA